MDYEEKVVNFRSLQESINTTTIGGKLISQVFCALAEFERNFIIERTHAGLNAYRARGRLGGRPKKININKTKTLNKLYD